MGTLEDRVGFAGFVLERSQRRLLRSDGTPVRLTPRLFSALLLFTERAGDLLDKDTLMAALWPGLVVEENNLSQVVHGLRRALGDEGGHLIQTVPRRGFRFVATLSVLPAAGPMTAALEAQGTRASVSPLDARPAVELGGRLGNVVEKAHLAEYGD
jgi:DNA-binding winged helix-turn-helix (wHTH) protein